MRLQCNSACIANGTCQSDLHKPLPCQETVPLDRAWKLLGVLLRRARRESLANSSSDRGEAGGRLPRGRHRTTPSSPQHHTRLGTRRADRNDPPTSSCQTTAPACCHVGAKAKGGAEESSCRDDGDKAASKTITAWRTGMTGQRVPGTCACPCPRTSGPGWQHAQTLLHQFFHSVSISASVDPLGGALFSANSWSSHPPAPLDQRTGKDGSHVVHTPVLWRYHQACTAQDGDAGKHESTDGVECVDSKSSDNNMTTPVERDQAELSHNQFGPETSVPSRTTRPPEKRKRKPASRNAVAS